MNREVVSLCSEFILPHASECMVGYANRTVVTSQTKAATKNSNIYVSGIRQRDEEIIVLKMLIDVPIHLIYQKNLKILTNCHQRNVYNIFRSGVVASSQFIRDSNSNSMRKTYRNLK